MNNIEMKIKRKVKSDNFTILDNNILKRSDMSARSKGVFAHILSLPDDWVVYKSELFRHHKEGYDALNTAFNELKELGYINHYSVRDENGRIKRWDCDIYEDPNDNPVFKKKKIDKEPDRELPDQAEPELDYPEQGYPEQDYPEQDIPDLLSTYSTNNLLYKELSKLIDDDDINKELSKIITSKIIKKLEIAGVGKLTPTKLIPLARAMSKLMVVYKQDHEEVEEVILLAVEIFELNNGRSINYIIKLLKDWEENNLYNTESIRKYISNYKKDSSETNEQNIEPVPMINWLKNLN